MSNTTSKTVLSCSIPVVSKQRIELKAKQTGRTMSDIVTQLIDTAFSSKHGLAKRIEAEKVNAKKKLQLALDNAVSIN